MRVCICSTKIPFSHGGAEILDDSLESELVRRGFDVEQINLPFNWSSRRELLKSGLLWRLLDLKTGGGEEIDLVIATRFPSYLIRHPNKVVWLYHQFRQAYDLHGTRFGFLDRSEEDQTVVETIQAMDRRGLGEARALFAIARNVAQRLQTHNGLEARTLYPPPKLADRMRCEEYGDYLFFAGRLDEMKRVETMIRAFAFTRTAVRGRIAGTGPRPLPRGLPCSVRRGLRLRHPGGLRRAEAGGHGFRLGWSPGVRTRQRQRSGLWSCGATTDGSCLRRAVRESFESPGVG